MNCVVQKLKYVEKNNDDYSKKLKTNSKKIIRIFKFLLEIFLKMFEGIKIVTTFDCVRVLVPKG